MTEGPQVGLTRLRLFAVGGAASLVPLNSTMVAVALPRIAKGFDISVGRTSVLVTAYLVVMLVGQPVAGRAADRFGVTRTMEVSLVCFAAASVVAAVAPQFSVLVAARVAQAVFGAALVPGAQALVRSAAAPSDSGRMFGILGSMFGVGAASGPVVGGALISIFGWRSIFVVNLPVVVLALAARLPATSSRTQPSELHVAVEALPLARNAVFVAAFMVQALSTLGQYMLLLVAPVLLDARGWSPAPIGLALSGLTVGLIVMSPIGGRAGDRLGRRRPVTVGLGVCAVALLGAAVGGASIASPQLIVVLTAFGFGLGFALPSVQTAALEVVAEHRVGSAAGVLSMSRYVGSITTSLLVGAWLASDGAGARGAFVVATVAAAGALVMGARLPSAPRAPKQRPDDGAPDEALDGTPRR